jgi:hypothetical protein
MEFSSLCYHGIVLLHDTLPGLLLKLESYISVICAW